MTKPGWIKVSFPSGKEREDYILTKVTIMQNRLNTVCTDATCPNIYECWKNKTATFMILGNLCTRRCRFCSVSSSARGEVVDANEPDRISMVAHKLGMSYVVLTSVTRDDLLDGGAAHFANCISSLKKSGAAVELLIPDFGGSIESIKTIIAAKPEVIGHNIETVKRLQKNVRNKKVDYKISLNVLKNVKKLSQKTITKSAIMLGLGETRAELLETMKDLRSCGVDIIVLGQYLPPEKHHLKVYRYLPPEEFAELKRLAEKMGFKSVTAGPLVRSSYRAKEAYEEALRKN